MNKKRKIKEVSSLKDVLILLAHGSRNPATEREISQLAFSVNRAVPAQAVNYAFLDGIEPDLSIVVQSVVRTGATRIRILPLFLNTGNHMQRDFPQMIQNLRDQYPQATLHCLQHIGAHPKYALMIEEMAKFPENYGVAH
jgi:sirohydrochlorin cobaltochelatase